MPVFNLFQYKSQYTFTAYHYINYIHKKITVGNMRGKVKGTKYQECIKRKMYISVTKGGGGNGRIKTDRKTSTHQYERGRGTER